MERGSRSILDLTDEGDAKYVTEMSTVLVAKIQETKDRISVIEHIFCSELFPNIQSKWKTMQEVCFEAQKAAEEKWRVKEIGLLGQIEELETENQRLSEENKELKKAKTEKKQEKCFMQLLDCNKSLHQKINELEHDIKEKSIKLKEAEESSNTLCSLVQRDAKHLAVCEHQLNEQKRKTSELIEQLEGSRREICKLQEDLRNKCSDDEAKKLREDLLKKVECQSVKITNYEGILKGNENEMKLQSINLKQMKESVNELQGGLEIKSKEVDEGKKVQQQLAQQIEQKSSQLLTVEQHLMAQQCENNKLLLKINDLEGRVGKLQVALQDKMIDQERKEESIRQLSHTIELKKSELVSEKKKTCDVLDRYKKLTSQYNYLLKKTGLESESMPAKDKRQATVNSVIDAHNPAALTDVKKKVQTIECAARHSMKLKDDSGWNKHQHNEEGVRSGQASEPRTTGFVTVDAQKEVNRRKASPLVGTKRPASRWRETRSHQNQDGPDPHDDFLNTPFENIRENLNKVMVEEVQDLPDPVPLEVNLSSSDDEVQKIARTCSEWQQKQPSVPCSKSYKYVEPVRKKADRDNLKGVECKQCKKFYDAVLPNGDGNEKNLRCEHHDGVSRHRYKYAPPMTPEGFWNIGFDSEK
ncbi:hypothetical protein QQ045_025883 [Rhodiola kirilowii]